MDQNTFRLWVKLNSMHLHGGQWEGKKTCSGAPQKLPWFFSSVKIHFITVKFIKRTFKSLIRKFKRSLFPICQFYLWEGTQHTCIVFLMGFSDAEHCGFVCFSVLFSTLISCSLLFSLLISQGYWADFQCNTPVKPSINNRKNTWSDDWAVSKIFAPST